MSATTSRPSTAASASSPAATERRGLGSLVLAEWTKFRTVRGWVAGTIVAGLLMCVLGLLLSGNVGIGCQNGPNGPQLSGKACLPYVPKGQGGEYVSDSFNFVHQPLTGNGSITARVISFSGQAPRTNGSGRFQVGGTQNLMPWLNPWAKAGVIVKQSTKQGSAYAAVMVTGGHGVRMQYDYTGDIAGPAVSVSRADPRWLRVTRSGDTITGYESANGTSWTKVGAVQLTGLPGTVQVGVFATSPGYTVTQNHFGGTSSQGGPAQATGVFDHVTVSGTTRSGAAAAGTWATVAVGGGGPIGQGPGASPSAGVTRAGGTFSVTGSGDIAPVTPSFGNGYPTATIEQTLTGMFIGMIAIVVVAAMFFTAEYRRGLIRTSFAAAPRRGEVLAAKAIVIGLVAFVVALVASIVAIAFGVPAMTNSGQLVLPVSALTEARVEVGTAALVALFAVIAVSLGAVLRRSAAAITIGIVVVVLPFLLAALNVFPYSVSVWLLRATPAAGFAIEQSIPDYHQVFSSYSVNGGYYPLPPWGGLAVVCLYAAAALGLATYLLRRRDA